MAEIYGLTAIRTANLKAYYKLSDVTDDAASYDLTNNGTTTFAAGKFGNAADFGASNSTKWLNNTDLLGLTSEATRSMCGWIKISAQPESGVSFDAISMTHATEWRGYYLGYRNIGGTYYVFGGGYKQAVGDYQATKTITLGTGDWHHLAMTFSAGTVLFYFDGAYEGTVEIPTGNGSSAGTLYSGPCIGRLQNTAAYQYYSGLVDDVAFFDDVLTADEIRTIYSDTGGSFLLNFV